MSKFLLLSVLLVCTLSGAFAGNKSFDVTKVFNATNHTVYAGYMNTSENTTSQMFYHMFSPQGKSFDNSQPIVVWFQGGPGCSGWVGSLLEIGPFQIVQKNGTLETKYNPYNWAQDNNLLFIDQPFGVGYSSVGNGTAPNMTETAADQVVVFFEEFFKTYPKLKSNPLYMSGESYGGHYVPSFTARLINKGYKISGMMIGDGWTYPMKQITLSNYQLAAGIISAHRYGIYHDMEERATKLLLQGKYSESSNYFDGETGEVPNKNDIGNITGADLLNYRKYGGEIDSDFSAKWLDSSKIREAFQVPKDVGGYLACSVPIYETFSNDVLRSFAGNFTQITKATNVLLYSGQNDIEVNTASAYKWISEMDWYGSDAFAASKKQQWKPKNNGQIQGFYKKSDSLTFVQINNAGHLVPQDQPENAYSMISSWMNGNL